VATFDGSRDLAERFARLIGCAADAEPIFIAGRLAGLRIDGDKRRGEAMREVAGYVADGSALALNVEQRHAAFGGGIKLEDLRNAEAILECVPNLRRQSIAAGQADAMFDFFGRSFRVQKIAAELADVLEQRAVPAGDIAPELAGREPLAHHDRRAGHQHCAGHLHAANAVIHGQAVVHSVDGLHVHHASKPVAPLHDAAVADPGGLGQSGGAGGVDVESEVVDCLGAPLARGESLAGVLLKLLVDAGV
jgi:hypothetical protein